MAHICHLRHCSYISMKVKVSRRLRARFLPSMEFVGLAKLGFVTSPVGIICPDASCLVRRARSSRDPPK